MQSLIISPTRSFVGPAAHTNPFGQVLVNISLVEMFWTKALDFLDYSFEIQTFLHNKKSEYNNETLPWNDLGSGWTTKKPKGKPLGKCVVRSWVNKESLFHPNFKT